MPYESLDGRERTLLLIIHVIVDLIFLVTWKRQLFDDLERSYTNKWTTSQILLQKHFACSNKNFASFQDGCIASKLLGNFLFENYN